MPLGTLPLGAGWWDGKLRPEPFFQQYSLLGGVFVKCQELAASIQSLQPAAHLRDVARLCLLLANTVDDPDSLGDQRVLCQQWQQTGLRLQAVTDQHAAMTEELEKLARVDPRDFTPDQIWTLVRAIKIQSQVLQMYVGRLEAEV